ncbi:MAG: N-methyl-L-tryptophan oxidase [Akkermansiaceae bacterium]|nr:N-methyl-L-tryptophan oxidase [Armatimonadota bacterium]
MKIAVVGVGGTGSAACRHLAKAGHTVVGYEQFRVGHTRGSSHGESRIIRYTYPDPLFTGMMGDAYPLWAGLESEAREELFVRCGGVLIAPEGHADLRDTRESIESAGLPFEELTPGETAARFPAFRLAADEIALYQKDSGFLRATRCVRAQARIAAVHGAEIREATAVHEVASRNGKPVVRTEGGEEPFDAVIVTAGAWMGKLMHGLNLPLSVERRQVVYLRIARSPEHFAPEQFPIWIDARTLYYGFPSDGVIQGVKLASHVAGYAVDPDNDGREPAADIIAEALEIATRRFPDLSDQVAFTQVCLYTSTASEDFIMDYAPDLPNVFLISGCSGHGFKFTVLLGKIAADIVTGKTYPRDLSRFALSRFV